VCSVTNHHQARRGISDARPGIRGVGRGRRDAGHLCQRHLPPVGAHIFCHHILSIACRTCGKCLYPPNTRTYALPTIQRPAAHLRHLLAGDMVNARAGDARATGGLPCLPAAQLYHLFLLQPTSDWVHCVRTLQLVPSPSHLLTPTHPCPGHLPQHTSQCVSSVRGFGSITVCHFLLWRA